MGVVKKVKERLFGSIPAHFIDPVTKLVPANEIQLTSLLALYHQRSLIDWNCVNLYDADNKPSGKMASSLFSQNGSLCCEWPLFAATDEQISIWGQMTADLLYLSVEDDIIVLVENKIGSGFTSGGSDVETGQLARQIEYLMRGNISNRRAGTLP